MTFKRNAKLDTSQVDDRRFNPKKKFAAVGKPPKPPKGKKR